MKRSNIELPAILVNGQYRFARRRRFLLRRFFFKCVCVGFRVSFHRELERARERAERADHPAGAVVLNLPVRCINSNTEF